MIDFTDTEKPEETPPPVPEGKTEIKDPGQGVLPSIPDPSVSEVTAPPAEQTPPSNEPAPAPATEMELYTIRCLAGLFPEMYSSPTVTAMAI